MRPRSGKPWNRELSGSSTHRDIVIKQWNARDNAVNGVTHVQENVSINCRQELDRFFSAVPESDWESYCNLSMVLSEIAIVLEDWRHLSPKAMMLSQISGIHQLVGFNTGLRCPTW